MGLNKAEHQGLFSGFPAICRPTLGHLPFACPVCRSQSWGLLGASELHAQVVVAPRSPTPT